MAFEKVAASRGSGRGGGRKVDTPQIAFYHNVGAFRFNRAALDALGNPEKVSILHDAGSNVIAVVPDEDGASFRAPDKSGSKMLSYGSFASIASAAAPGAAKVRGTLVQDGEYWTSNMLNETANAASADAETATEAAVEGSDGAVETATGGRRATRR